MGARARKRLDNGLHTAGRSLPPWASRIHGYLSTVRAAL